MFYPIAESNKNVLSNYANLFFCFDNPEKVEINGDFSTESGKNLYIDFNLCLNDEASQKISSIY